MSIAAKSPPNQTEGGSPRSHGPSGASARLAGTPPFSGARRAASNISASLSPGRRVFFDGGAACGCGIGAIGSGSTLGADWLDAAPYEWEPIGSSAMRALPNAAGACGPQAGSEGDGPASQGNDDESSGCAAAGRRGAEESVKDPGDGQGSVEYRHGTLGAKAEGAQEGLKNLSKRVDDGFGRLDQRIDDLSKRVDDGFGRQDQRLDDLSKKVDDGFERQRQEVKSDIEKQNQRIDDLSKSVDDGFERQRQEVKSDIEKQNQRIDDLSKSVDDGFERQRQEVKSDIEKQNQRIDDGFERQRQEVKSDIEKQNQRIENGFKEQNQRIENGFKEQSQKIDEGFKKFGEQYNNFKGELRKPVVALMIGLILAAAGAYFAGLF